MRTASLSVYGVDKVFSFMYYYLKVLWHICIINYIVMYYHLILLGKIIHILPLHLTSFTGPFKLACKTLHQVANSAPTGDPESLVEAIRSVGDCLTFEELLPLDIISQSGILPVLVKALKTVEKYEFLFIYLFAPYMYFFGYSVLK